jgi:hypothetical protein
MLNTTHNAKTSKSWIVFLWLVFFFTIIGPPQAALGGQSDVLLGVTGSDTMIDFGAIDANNFSDYFTYKGAATPSYTINGEQDVQIGAIWTGGNEYEWREIRIIIDSNGDGDLTPFDWSDPAHPWNPPTDNPQDGDSWTYTYPNDYPRDDLRGETITITWDGNCWCTDFPWDTWEHWWYESSADKTDSYWGEKNQLMNVWWSGRDQNWNMLPNGDYLVKVWVDENGDWEFASTEANKTMLIRVETASISGKVVDGDGDPIVGANIEAGSHMAWGQALSKSDGTFTVSGLQAGAGYHLRIQADGKVASENHIELPAGQSTVNAGTFTLNEAIAITGTVKLDRNANGVTDEAADKFQKFTNQWGWEQFDLWVWVDGWNMQGPGWANTDVRFEAGDASVDFSLNIAPPQGGTARYQININAEGYAATPIYVDVDDSGGSAGTIVLTKASLLSGTVKLPEPVDMWSHIDVQAISIDDPDIRYWGWGNIDPYQSTDTGEFRIDGIPAGTYTVEVRVMGFATKIVSDVLIVQGEDKDLGQLEISTGSKITGTLTIQGDTSTLQRWHGDSTSGTLDIWLDAWSHSGGWSGTNIQFDRGVNKSATFSLGGLSDATYEINCWIGEGYELVDENGNSPVFVAVSGNATQNLVLKPHEGIVQGTISGNGISVDYSKVVVEVKRPWDWLPPKIATVANGGIDPNTGFYRVSGLGTGDYVVKVGVYDGFMNWSGQESPLSAYQSEGHLIANADVGVVMQRAFVQNNADNPTTLDIALERGYAISGTVSLDNNDLPWHDFGDGSGGDPDGRKDLKADPFESEAISMAADVIGQPVMAMPMDMMFMGGEDPRMGIIDQEGNYRIDGLAPGVYTVMPPFSSQRINQMNRSSYDDFHHFDGGEQTHHWTATTQMVVITHDDVTDKDFVLGNGHTVTGQLTLPEAQTYDEEWEAWHWVGHLELETANHEFMGHGKPLMKRDFANGNRYEFEFHHVANGDYLVRFWTDRYVPSSAKFTVQNANAAVNLTVEEGANLVGKLVDADTGEAVTSDDGVRVICEAIPWVEGSWRETRQDQWSMSYIEDGEDLMSQQNKCMDCNDNSNRTNNTPGKFHLNAVPTGHRYIIIVETANGKKTGGAKNYVGQVIAGIEVPEGATGDINVGTIQLKEGTTIQGRLTDSLGNPIPGVEVFALPSDTHDGSAEAEGVSDTQGYYTVYGVDPEVAYYDLIAAERPDMFHDWGKRVEWGEKRKYNIAPGATEVDFTLVRATASLSGSLSIPADAEFMIPFKGMGESFPATMILLQKKGVIYSDMLDGIEAMSVPMPSAVKNSTYTIDNIAPGTYKAIFMNYGLPTKIIDDVTIADGDNTLDVTWESSGFTVSGGLTLVDGGYPSSADISGTVVMNTLDQSITFGMLTAEADGTYSAYEVPGLAAGATYQLVFYKESGYDDTPEIFTSGAAFSVEADLTDNDAVIDPNTMPILMSQAVQNADSASQIDIGIFSTGYLVNSDIEVVDRLPTSSATVGEVFVSTGNGTIDSVTLSNDKRKIRLAYVKGSGDSDVVLTLAVHYGEDALTLVKTIAFNVNTIARNSDAVNVFIAGQVKLGNGDASQIYVPAGSLDTSDDGKAIVTIEKTSLEPGELEGASLRSVSDLGVFARSALQPLPSTATAAGDQYDFSYVAAGDGATADQIGTVVVQIEYDPERVDDVEKLHIMHLTGGEWVQEETNRTVDTDNHTISVEVTSLSPFLAAVVATSSSGGGADGGTAGSSSSSGSGGGGPCFITTAQGNFTNLLGYLIPAIVLLGFALRTSTREK